MPDARKSGRADDRKIMNAILRAAHRDAVARSAGTLWAYCHWLRQEGVRRRGPPSWRSPQGPTRAIKVGWARARDRRLVDAGSFAYTVSDGIAAPVAGSVAISISPQNDAPVVASGSGPPRQRPHQNRRTCASHQAGRRCRWKTQSRRPGFDPLRTKGRSAMLTLLA